MFVSNFLPPGMGNMMSQLVDMSQAALAERLSFTEELQVRGECGTGRCVRGD